VGRFTDGFGKKISRHVTLPWPGLVTLPFSNELGGLNMTKKT